MSATSRRTRRASPPPSRARSRPPPTRAPGRTVTSIFLGGGTPSLMEPATVGDDPRRDRQALAGRRRRRGHARGQSVERRGRPLPRLSRRRRQPRLARRPGARTIADLRFLGRLHNVAEALAAIEIARATFPRLSFDLIYARPGQTPEAWAAELKPALERACDHLSLYQLTIEDGTPFAALYRAGKLKTPDAGHRGRALRGRPRRSAMPPACRPTRSPTTRDPAPSAGTISSTGATTNMPGSAPAPTAG